MYVHVHVHTGDHAYGVLFSQHISPHRCSLVASLYYRVEARVISVSSGPEALAASEHQFLPHLINPKVHVIRSQSGLISLVCKNDLTPISTCVLSAEIGQLCEAHLVMWDWVLDSISVYRCQDLDAYLVQNITHGHDCSEPQDPND